MLQLFTHKSYKDDLIRITGIFIGFIFTISQDLSMLLLTAWGKFEFKLKSVSSSAVKTAYRGFSI